MGYLKIIRPINCLITFISVCIGAWVGTSLKLSPALILAAMVGFVVCAFGNVVNDLFDIDIDTVNNPQRPLIKKTVSKAVIIALALYFFVLAFLFGLSLGTVPFIIIIGTLFTLFFYAWILKKTLTANIVISLITGCSFILGGLIAKNPYCVYPFIFSFFIHFSREIVKDLIDKQGDEQFGVRSIPIVYGNRKACTLSAISLSILCIILPIPFFLRILNIWYFLIVLIGAYPICIYTAIRLLHCPPIEELVKNSRHLKVIMVIGLIAMIV